MAEPTIRFVRNLREADMEMLFPQFPRASQRKTFYAQIGRSIATWQRVEAHLYEVYRALTMAQRPGAEACAFYALGTFRIQLSVTDAAARFVFSGMRDKTLRKTLSEEWANLRNAAQNKANRRNEIAHGAVWLQQEETRRARRIYIGPIATNPLANLKEPKQANQDPEPMTLARLKEYEKDFERLAVRLFKFARRIAQLPTPT